MVYAFCGQNEPGTQGGLPVLDLSEGAGIFIHTASQPSRLCEAYAMTEDELLGPAQAAINYIVYAQCRDGGWRYDRNKPMAETFRDRMAGHGSEERLHGALDYSSENDSGNSAFP